MLAHRFLQTFTLTSAILLASCHSGLSTDAPRSAPLAEPAPGPVLTLDPSTTSTVSGSVTLNGPPPAPQPIHMAAEPDCQQMHPTAANYPDVITGPNGSLADVVIYIRSGLGNYRFSPPATTILLDQKGCLYEPEIVALMVGQRLEIRNSDPTVHNIHSLARRNPPWNQSQPQGTTLFETFARSERAIPLVCNVHPWMRGFAFVFDNPYFAVTNSSGKFSLQNLPPGTYTIEAWHQRYGTLDQSISLAPHSSASISFVFRSSATP
jgi:plastocyanin